MHISLPAYTKLTLLFALLNSSLLTFSDTPSPSSLNNILNQTHALAQLTHHNAQAVKNMSFILPVIHTAPTSGYIAKCYATITASAKTVCAYAYLPYIAAGGIIASGSGYWWYRKQLKKIDWTPNYDPRFTPCRIPGMVGECPTDACTIIEELKANSMLLKNGLVADATTEYDNVLLLEGPTGIGKTTLAQAIAKETNSNYVRIVISNVSSPYIGESKNIINQTIALAIAQAEADGTHVIICFDEADGMSSADKNSPAYREAQQTYTAIWEYMDKYHRSPRVSFVFATNNPDNLPTPLKNRLNLRTIHMKNPDAQQRKELFYYFSKRDIKKEIDEYCPNNCIEKLLRETKHYSIRDISGVISHAKKYSTNLKEPIARKHLMHGLDIMNTEVKRQNTPSKEQLERQESIAREKEHLWWTRLNGAWTIMNIASKIPFPEKPTE